MFSKSDAPGIDERSESYFLGSEYGVYFDKPATVISADLACQTACRVIEVNKERIFLRAICNLPTGRLSAGGRFFVVFEGRIFDCTQTAAKDGFILAQWNRIYLAGEPCQAASDGFAGILEREESTSLPQW